MFYIRVDIIKGMNENLFELFGEVFVTDFSITGDDYKKIIDLGEYGQFETYSLFPGIVLAFIDTICKIMKMYMLKKNFLQDCL